MFPKILLPRRIAVVFSCDNRAGLLPCERTDEFDATEALPTDIARKTGWKIDRDGLVYCPACKGTKR
jgi:hypothetical protein